MRTTTRPQLQVRTHTSSTLRVGRAAACVAMAALLAAACSSKSSPSTAASGASTSASSAVGAASGSMSSGAAMVQTGKGAPGTFLTDSQGRTLYLFAADTSTTSTCYQTCAQYWPPLLTSGAPAAGGQADATKLGTTKRTDGKTQVTYNGHPLYTFVSDKAPGATNGQGKNLSGGLWWVVSPDGKAITASAAATASSGSRY